MPKLKGMLVRVAAATAILMLCFESAQQLPSPHITIWLSHFITICFTTILGVAAAYTVGHRLINLRQEQTVKTVGLYWLVINQPPVVESSEHLAGLAHDRY